MTEAATDTVIARTQQWLERAVIGLNLCPFAKAEHVHGRIRYCVSGAHTEADLLADLERALLHLQASDPAHTETTLLIHPQVLADFWTFNGFLNRANALVVALKLDGVLQIASFHPDYQFADASADDISNYTNRAPYPTLHLLREASIDRAVASFPEAEAIYQRNIDLLRQLGHSGWQRLMSAAD